MADVEGVKGLHEIGRGGFGVVYRATETDLNREVAVKLLPPQLDENARNRFDRERRSLGALSGHPHIVAIHRSGRTAEHEPFLVMEFCQRGSISDELETAGTISWTRAVDLAVKLAGALETAHRAGIVHRDIKPANVLLSNLGEPKLADFGIARIEGAPETRSASITASIAHAAPEVLDGQRPDARSDVYSLASTVYEIISGRPPFVHGDEESMLPILNRIAQAPVPPLAPQAAPPAVAAALTRAMAKSPESRPQTARQFGEWLMSAQRESGVAPTTMMVEDLGDAEASEPDPEPTGGMAMAVAALGFQPPRTYDPSGSGETVSATWAPPSAVGDDTPSRSRTALMAFVGFASVGVLAAVVAAAVFLAGRTGDTAAASDTSTTTSPEPTGGDVEPTSSTSEPEATEAVPIVADEPLAIGTFLPDDGPLASLVPAALAAAELAVADVNAAGGVLGTDVAFHPVGSGDERDIENAQAGIRSLSEQSVDVVVGPFTSGLSKALIEDPVIGEMILFSPSATSADLTTLDTNNQYFRTSPDEVSLTNIAADVLRDEDVGRLAVAHVNDGYGTNISDRFLQRYAQLGGVVLVDTDYDPGVADFGEIAASLADQQPDAIVIVGYDETDQILAALAGLGVGPSIDGTTVMGIDANYLLFGEPDVLSGYRGLVARVDLRPLAVFTGRLEDVGVDPGNEFAFAPESYDAVIISALAAEISGATSGPDLAAAIVGVTRDGDKCFDFAECKRLIGEGRDIDYEGLAGPHEFTDAGDPRVSSYLIVTYDGGTSPNDSLNQFIFSR